MNKYAYVSLLGTNSYIGAAVVMMETWKKLNSKYPFYLLVTEAISQENKDLVSFLGYKVIEIEE